MANEDRFKDNENETLTDTKYNLTWTKQDSYQMRNKWCSWKGANNYINWLNEQKFAGFDDWRLPKSQECRNLYDHECKTPISMATSFISTINFLKAAGPPVGARKIREPTPWPIIFTATGPI